MIDAGVDPQSLALTENWLGLILFLLLCLFIFWDCLRAKPDADAPEIHTQMAREITGLRRR